MASILNTSITSYDYLLRNCYSTNRNARKSFGRATLDTDELVKADSNALKKIATSLRSIEYDSKHGKSIYNGLKVFTESYNNLIDSTDKASSPQVERAEKKLKKFLKENKEKQKKIGIKVSSSGKLTIKDSTLLSTDASKISKIFSSSSNFTSTVAQHATRINRLARIIQRSGSSNQSTTTVTPPVTTSVMTANAIDYQA